MIGLTFGKSKRLLNAKDYKAVFDHSEYKASHKYALVLARQNHLDHPRLGVIVAKKNARKAVDRSRLKRIIREQFRLQQHRLGNKDIVVLARSGLVGLENRNVHDIVNSLLRKIGRKQHDSGANH